MNNAAFLKRKQFFRKMKARRSIISMPGKAIISSDKDHKDIGKAGDVISEDGKEINPILANDLPIEVVENENPERIRVVNSPGRGRIKNWKFKLAKFFAPRIPSKEDLAAMNDRQKLEILRKPVLEPEAEAAKKRISNCLTRLGICYIQMKDGKVKRVRRVRFNWVGLALDATYFHIDSDHLPFGVSISQLADEDTVTNLSVAVGHTIKYTRHKDSGCWFVMERASGTLGIPNHVNLVEMWERTPVSKDNLTIPVGMTHNSKPIYESLDNMVHLLIAGTTGGGKSNFLNVILCTLIRNNKPDRLRMLLVDLKGGLEFNYYGGIPHLLSIPSAKSGIVNERDEVIDLLDWVIGEGEKRMGILLKAEAKNIGEYNAHRTTTRMPHLVVVIDEWADVKLGRGGKDTEDRLANSVQRMRAVGIHVIVCTQVPQSQVLGTLIKANLPAKFAFSCADLQGSMAILNNAHALNLQPKGRCVFRYQEEIDIQTPFIPKTIIHDTVEGAISGSFSQAKKFDVTEQEVLEWALRENNGWLSKDKLYSHFKHRGLPQLTLEEWLREFEEKEHLIGNSLFHVTPSEGSRPRRLVATDREN